MQSFANLVSESSGVDGNKIGLSDIMKKAVPKFRTEDAEREFWASHDSTEYIDWRRGKRVTLANLKSDHLKSEFKS